MEFYLLKEAKGNFTVYKVEKYTISYFDPDLKKWFESSLFDVNSDGSLSIKSTRLDCWRKPTKVEESNPRVLELLLMEL